MGIMKSVVLILAPVIVLIITLVVGAEGIVIISFNYA